MDDAKKTDDTAQFEPYKMVYLSDRHCLVPLHHGKIPNEEEIMILIGGLGTFLKSLSEKEKQLLNEEKLTLEQLVNRKTIILNDLN